MTIEHKYIAMLCGEHAPLDGAALDAAEDALIHGRMNQAKTMKAIAEFKRCQMRKGPSTLGARLTAWLRRARG